MFYHLITIMCFFFNPCCDCIDHHKGKCQPYKKVVHTYKPPNPNVHRDDLKSCFHKCQCWKSPFILHRTYESQPIFHLHELIKHAHNNALEESFFQSLNKRFKSKGWSILAHSALEFIVILKKKHHRSKMSTSRITRSIFGLIQASKVDNKTLSMEPNG